MAKEFGLEDFEVVVTFSLHTTKEDIADALIRSGLIYGNLIGEALIEYVQVFPENDDIFDSYRS